MKNKKIVLVLILVIVSAGFGTGVSLAAGTIRINGRVEYLKDVEFTREFSITDNEEIDKNFVSQTNEEYLEDVEFTEEFNVTDNEEIDEDFASAIAIRSADGKDFQLTITNAYPGYKVYFDFTIKNVGNKDIGLELPILNNETNLDYDTSAFSFELQWIEWDDEPWLIHVGDTAVGRLTIEVLQGAVMGESYSNNIYFWFEGSEQ